MKIQKYDYKKVIQQNYGSTWEDVSEYITNSRFEVFEFTDKVVKTKSGLERKISLLAHDLKEYRLLGYSTRVISRKVLKSN